MLTFLLMQRTSLYLLVATNLRLRILKRSTGKVVDLVKVNALVWSYTHALIAKTVYITTKNLKLSLTLAVESLVPWKTRTLSNGRLVRASNSRLATMSTALLDLLLRALATPTCLKQRSWLYKMARLPHSQLVPHFWLLPRFFTERSSMSFLTFIYFTSIL